jgi:hypothetical protein
MREKLVMRASSASCWSVAVFVFGRARPPAGRADAACGEVEDVSHSTAADLQQKHRETNPDDEVVLLSMFPHSHTQDKCEAMVFPRRESESTNNQSEVAL